jgi:RNA methyltransferase, TrmH family
MIHKNTIKLIKSLTQKKQRQKQQLFLVEGDKNVLEVLQSSIYVNELIATGQFLEKHEKSIKNTKKITAVKPSEIKKASLLKTPQNCLAVCAIPSITRPPNELKNFALYLDGIQDPGNMGSIIRTCDWFGIEQLFCSPDTADIYNPKVIQASMGSFCRVKSIYLPFDQVAGLAADSKITVFGTFMNGQNIYNSQLPLSALVVVGNEGKGIRAGVEKNIRMKIAIPCLHHGKNRPESLNAAVTAGIVCSEFKRESARW